jgi:hypothetical protein
MAAATINEIIVQSGDTTGQIIFGYWINKNILGYRSKQNNNADGITA